MTQVFRRSDRRAAAETCPDAVVVEKRRLVRRLEERLGQFALRVKSNARWMRNFLHGR